ncbi:MAG: hypothetical protein KGM97_08910 [Alphaproteobacteria bacterium]|nr:hypothetical protein [Alphaproteobacteria bacterium]MDE2631095.1 hypothetical protein [Alphaproteobacteria bacterium]
MIPFHAGLLAPNALAMAATSLGPGYSDGGLEAIGATILEHMRQFKADLGGHPDFAEHIYQIVNSATDA